MKKSKLIGGLSFLFIFLASYSTLRAQAPLETTRWRAVGMLGNALQSQNIDTFEMIFDAFNDLQLRYSMGGTDTFGHGVWWQIDPSHFGFVDTTDVGLGSVCGDNDTGLIAYSISADTLTMVTSNDQCNLRQSLFFGSKFKSPNFNLGIGDAALINRELTIYPNPASDYISIKLFGPVSSKAAVVVQIADLTGKMVKNITTSMSGLNNISIADLDAGIYILSVTTGRDNKLITRLVVK
jgi:hypothetical protein